MDQKRPATNESSRSVSLNSLGQRGSPFERNLIPGPADASLSTDSSVNQIPSSPLLRSWTNPFLSRPELKMATKIDINQHPPFTDPMELLGVQAYDVIKIKNVPFAVTIPEVTAFVDRLTHAPLIKAHEQGYPVHVIMERPTGKTMDCFVEFQECGASKIAYQNASQILNSGKPLKIGTRHVDVQISSEGELCATLFPRAKSTRWDPTTGIPSIVTNRDPYSEGFQGFFTIEEITSVIKHATTPQKSTFSQRCPQRVYESMISTLYKFPWHVPLHYSVNARNFLWTAYMELLKYLVGKVQLGVDHRVYNQSQQREVGLGHSLLMEFIFAGLNVPMFSLRQKSIIVKASGPLGPGFPIPRQAGHWPFESLAIPYQCSPDAVDDWLKILEVGHRKSTHYGLIHGYEGYVNLGRDESGALKVEMNDAATALPFHNLISMEKGLMEFFVEQGRRELCSAMETPYQPLDLWGSLRIDLHRTSESTSQEIELVSPGVHKFRNRASGGHVGYEQHESDEEAHLVDEPGRIFKTTKSEAQSSRGSAISAPMNHFNPNTRPFIPSQPWNDAVPNEGLLRTPRRSSVADSVAEKSIQNNASLSYSSTSSSATPRKPSACAEPGSKEYSSVAQKDTRERTGNYQLHGEPSSDAFSRSHAQFAMPSGLRSNSASSESVTSSLQNQPLYSNVWGWNDSATSPSRSGEGAGVLRRSFSFGSGMYDELPFRGKNSPQTTPTQPRTVSRSFSHDYTPPQQPCWTDHELGSPAAHRSGSTTEGEIIGVQTPRTSAAEHAAFGPQCNQDNNYALTFRGGSPRGTRSRSSTGRNAIRIQATIHEEGELSTAETIHGADDISTDAGGVLL